MQETSKVNNELLHAQLAVELTDEQLQGVGGAQTARYYFSYSDCGTVTDADYGRDND